MEYSTKADIWSLGVTLYEAATAQPLYSAKKFDSPFAQLMAIVHEPPPVLPDTFSPPFREFVSQWYRSWMDVF